MVVACSAVNSLVRLSVRTKNAAHFLKIVLARHSIRSYIFMMKRMYTFMHVAFFSGGSQIEPLECCDFYLGGKGGGRGGN